VQTFSEEDGLLEVVGRFKIAGRVGAAFYFWKQTLWKNGGKIYQVDLVSQAEANWQ